MTFARLSQDTLRGRFAPLVVLATTFLALASVTRVVLFAHGLWGREVALRALPTVLLIGVLYDLVAALYLLAPLALYLFLLPQRLYASRAHRALLEGALFLATVGLVFLAPVEYAFFDEFDARFNLVAVDYLIYPHEVFVNIWQSYPVAWLLAAATAVAAGLFALARRPLVASFALPSRYRDRLPALALVAALLAFCYAAVDANTGRYSTNRVTNELAQDGPYALFAAAFTNELSYDQYYLTEDPGEAAARARRLVALPNAEFLAHGATPLARRVVNAGTPRKLNVVLLVQESLGADWVGAYGDTRKLTPNIDRLAAESLMFTNVYATGTRTVRGLEAISASFPPIPSESIVKRPHNERIFNWGEVMRRQGYAPTFIYGGYGTFDNMNYYFGHNGFEVHDRTTMPKAAFANIWGVSDEHLFHEAVKVFDAQHARGKRIFSIIMSTSNHKPFTFPESVAGVKPTGGGRESGVRYADYAIGKFLEEARTKPWFTDTVFMITGDHGARVYGREDIPLRSYELPLLLYSPKHIAPRKVDTLASQVDIMPTILGLLHLSYDTVDFGRDIFQGDPADRYVLMSHNHDVGMLRHGELTVLEFRKASATYWYDKGTNRQEPIAADEEQVKDAIGLYQEGASVFAQQRYRLD